MIYATLDEAWTRKPRIKRITQREKLKNSTFQNQIVLKDPKVISMLKDKDDPDAFILDLMTPKVSPVRESKTEPIKKEPKTEPKKEPSKDTENDDIIYFLYFLILLVLLY